MSVLCILGFLFRDANRIYKQTSLFTGGSSQSRTAINRATIYRLTVGLTTHIVAIGESNSERLDGAACGNRTRNISLEGWSFAIKLMPQIECINAYTRRIERESTYEEVKWW